MGEYSYMTGLEFPFDRNTVLIPTPGDFAITFGFAIVLTIARVYAQRAGLNLAKRLHVKEASKFSESCWKTVFYITSTSLGLAIVFTSDFFPDTRNCWTNWPNVPLSPAFHLFELFQLGFYWHSLYAHFVYEVKRSDYWPLLLHHIATIALIHGSYQLNFYRIGLLIVVAHDINDVFFEIGKIFVYLEKELITNILFVFLLISWVTTRLGILPFMLIYSSFFEATAIIPYDVGPFWDIFFCFLLFLQALHVYWFGLMLRMAVRVLRGKEKKIVDSREKEEKIANGTSAEGDSPTIESKTSSKKSN